MKKKGIQLFTFLVVICTIGYFIGPKPPVLELNNQLPRLNVQTNLLEQMIVVRESGIKNIKFNNQSRIVWQDSIKKNKTAYCIVYLHGFSASPEEGAPVHRNIARKFGCNLYLPRLYAHGLSETEPLLGFDEEKYLASAKEAVSEAFCLGEKVIIMATSTGGTLGLYIASGYKNIHGLILYSPNIDLFDSRSFLLLQPWGLHLARFIVGGNYYSFMGPAGAEKYWTPKYRVEALIRLKNLLKYTMTKETFNAVKQPVLMCYYYKNECEQDNVVSVPEMLKMFDELGTPNELKRKVAVPNAGAHALPSGLWSHDTQIVEKATEVFMEEKLHMQILQ